MKLSKIAQKRRAYSDKMFDVINVFLVLVLLVIFMWPLWFVVIASISDPFAVNRGEVLLLPKGITSLGYEYMMEYKQLWLGYANTIFYTVVGTALNMFFSICLAYPMSDKSFKPRKILMIFFMVTMYFGGGLIPNYLLMKSLHILDTRWAMILPGMISVYNSLIIRSYFMSSIPEELKEAATLDGANAAQYLVKVVLPLSKAVFAVVGLYYLVGHWNDYAHALYYLVDRKLVPLQSVLRELLVSTKIEGDLISDPAVQQQVNILAQSMKFCVIMAASVPVLCVYPYIQRYFVKGVMVGSVKG